MLANSAINQNDSGSNTCVYVVLDVENTEPYTTCETDGSPSTIPTVDMMTT